MKIKIFLTVLLVLSGLCLSEPLYRDKLTFATTYPTAQIDNLKNIPNFVTAKPEVPITRQRAHAPEPTTLFLMLSGLGGLIIRFARKSFDRFKRASDIALSIIALTIVSPILLIAAILIKTNSRGPVIYKQLRVGKNHKVFRIYKLRTMAVDAEKFTGAVWAKKNDTRITSVGKFLRKTHIDEIPQFINVLKGEMSIVGPRPERPEMVSDLKELIKDYGKRLQVNPGITGLAQTARRYDETVEDVKKKIKFDLLYIRKMCFWTDITIFGRTFAMVLTGKVIK